MLQTTLLLFLCSPGRGVTNLCKIYFSQLYGIYLNKIEFVTRLYTQLLVTHPLIILYENANNTQKNYSILLIASIENIWMANSQISPSKINCCDLYHNFDKAFFAQNKTTTKNSIFQSIWYLPLLPSNK